MRAYVAFRLGGAALALDATRVIAVASSSRIIRVPFARPCVAGVLERHGRLVPVVDLALVSALWNELPRGGGDKVVILGVGEIEAGFLASAVEATRAEETTDAPAGAGAALSHAREAILCGAVRAGDRAWGLLRIETALAAAGLPAQEN